MDWLTYSPWIILTSIALVSLLESFAFIGIIVPGVVLLFSLSALANTVSIPIGFVLMSAGLGAAAGDITSYAIGYKFKRHLHQIRWIKQHQNWLIQGTWFIEKWGWLSIIIGRFLGPLRPIVPILTGTLGMAPSRFIPLSLLTALIWAPVYLLPGYYTGELANLWELQPLGNRSLIIYALTMASIAGGALVIYHHTHPEKLLIKGWLTPRQAYRWPIHSSSLAFLSITIFCIIYFAAPVKIDLSFHRWSNQWLSHPSTELWNYLATMNQATLPLALLSLINFWLILNRRLKLMLAIVISYISLLIMTFLLDNFAPLIKELDHLNTASSLIYLIALMANLYSNNGHRDKRWPLYLASFMAMLVFIVSLMWTDQISMSAGIASLSLGLGCSALVRIICGIMNISFNVSRPQGIILLLLLVSFSFAAVG